MMPPLVSDERRWAKSVSGGGASQARVDEFLVTTAWRNIVNAVAIALVTLGRRRRARVDRCPEPLDVSRGTVGKKVVLNDTRELPTRH
jgi:hypothetical protein